jgi:hypothetical protein
MPMKKVGDSAMDVGTTTSASISSYQALQPEVQAPAAAPASPAAQTAASAAAQPAVTGGLDNNSAAALLASLNHGAQQAAPMGPSATQAIAAYQAQQTYPVSTPPAQTSPSSTPTTPVADTPSQTLNTIPASTPPPPEPDAISSAAVQQAALASINPQVTNLLA